MNTKSGMILALLASVACAPENESSSIAKDDLLAIDTSCTGAGCQNQTDTKVAGGGGQAIAATQAAARTTGIANAERDAKIKAKRLLNVPPCPDGCKQLGGVHKEATIIANTSNCQWTLEAQQPPTAPRDTNGDGIDDWWGNACTGMHGRNINDTCNSTTTVANKPWFAWCGSHARANGLRVCVDNLCACADLQSADLVAVCEAAVEEAAVGIGD